MHDRLDLDRAAREEIRWRILKVLDASRLNPVTETIIFRVVAGDLKLALTPNKLREELSYLEERGLVRVTGRDESVWLAQLTRAGVDIVEYTVPIDPGIARPHKFWE